MPGTAHLALCPCMSRCTTPPYTTAPCTTAPHLVLNEAVHVVVAGVVPHALRRQLHGEVVAGLLVVQHSRAAAVAAAAGMAADETDPHLLCVGLGWGLGLGFRGSG